MGRRGQTCETLAIRPTLALAPAVFAAAVAEKSAGRFMIRSRTRVVKQHPRGDWRQELLQKKYAVRCLDQSPHHSM
jgi:hypothetical protein